MAPLPKLDLAVTLLASWKRLLPLILPPHAHPSLGIIPTCSQSQEFMGSHRVLDADTDDSGLTHFLSMTLKAVSHPPWVPIPTVSATSRVDVPEEDRISLGSCSSQILPQTVLSSCPNLVSFLSLLRACRAHSPDELSDWLRVAVPPNNQSLTQAFLAPGPPGISGHTPDTSLQRLRARREGWQRRSRGCLLPGCPCPLSRVSLSTLLRPTPPPTLAPRALNLSPLGAFPCYFLYLLKEGIFHGY